jgi:uncharacterized protein
MRLWVVLVMMSCTAACSSGDGREMAVPDTIVPPASPTTSDGVAALTSPQSGGVATAPTNADSSPLEPVGFERVAATITTASGATCELCVWLAASPDQRSRGLMGVTDLGEGDGMIFRYPIATTTQFWMKNTPMPLSIVFFDTDGVYLEAFDMEPCMVDTCPGYPTAREFLDAIEFPQGVPTELGIGPGSVLDVSDLPCGG